LEPKLGRGTDETLSSFPPAPPTNPTLKNKTPPKLHASQTPKPFTYFMERPSNYPHPLGHSGETPTAEAKAEMARRHEMKPGSHFPSNPHTMGPNVGTHGVSFLSKGYASTTAGTISGSGKGLAPHPLGGKVGRGRGEGGRSHQHQPQHQQGPKEKDE